MQDCQRSLVPETIKAMIDLKYLREEEIDEPRYVSFFEKYHGAGSFATWGKRIHWYFASGQFRLLVATIDGNYVGQSTAYRAKALVRGEEKEIWWGADFFVLEEMRGKGIGMQLQQKLHEDLPNFSSVAYAAASGFIKRKCGAREIRRVPFFFYPISCFFTLLLELALRKLTSTSVRLPRLRLPSFYLKLNSLFSASAKGLAVREIAREEVPELSDFMEACLGDEDFHIVRSKEFLKWKYVENPLISFKAFSLEREGERIGVAILSDVYEGKYLVSQARLSKLYDLIVKKDSGISEEQALKAALDYLQGKWRKAPDGVMAIQDIPFCPKIVYPRNRAFLSTMDDEELGSCYLSYIDQDMEKME